MDKLKLLASMLNKAYKIESAFESKAEFKAFIEVADEEQKKVIFKLMVDSERHKAMLENLAKELNFELEKASEKFDFSDKRIFNEIYKLELTAKSFYEQIASEFQDVLKDKIEILSILAKEEEMHAKLVERFVDKTIRIM